MTPQSTSRRRFAMWAAATVGTAAAALTAWRTTGYEVQTGIQTRLRFFAPWQYLVVNAAGSRIVAPEVVDVGLFADRYLAELPAADRRDICSLIGFVEHGAPLLAGRLGRFTALGPEVQDAVLRRVEASASGKLRGGFNILKAVSYMALYHREDSWEAIGYTGPVVPRGLP